jgi:anti-sigma factor RsiW
MSHEDVEELLGVYSLDALDRDEAALVEAHLSECPRCSAEVTRHHEVAGLLANSGSEAPPDLWDRISGRLERPDGPNSSDSPEWDRLAARLKRPPGTPDVLARAGAPPPPDRSEAPTPVVPLDGGRRRNRLVIRGITLLAGAAAVLAVWLGVQVAHLNHQVGQLQSVAGRTGLSRAVQSALEEPSTERVTLMPPAGQKANSSSVTVALTSSGAAYLIPRDLSDLPRGRTYQLWGQINGQLISLGLLGPHPGVTAFSVNPQTQVSSFAITAERSGGAVQPTSTPVVQGAVRT